MYYNFFHFLSLCSYKGRSVMLAWAPNLETRPLKCKIASMNQMALIT